MSNTVISPTDSQPTDSQPPPSLGWLVYSYRDRLWLMLMFLILAAFFLGGCHARGGGHVHASSCGSSSGDSVLAVFYVVYLIGWIIASSAGG